MRIHPKERGPKIIRYAFKVAFASQILFSIAAVYAYKQAEDRDFRYSMHKHCNWALNWYYRLEDQIDTGAGSVLRAADQAAWRERAQ